MLYFSKTKIIVIYFLITILTFFSLTNLIDNEDNLILSKNINLGLDLQGGSYLLLEVDSKPVIKQKLQNKLINLRKIFKEKNIKYENLKIKNNQINFELSKNDLIKFEEFFLNKDNTFNTYLEKYKSFQLEHLVNTNLVIINYTKFGIIEIKNLSLEQSL